MSLEFRKICNPLLPQAQDVLAYLDVPDQTRWYANRGQLVRTLETRLSSYLGADKDILLTTATGTAALEAAILATAGRAGPDRPLALMPSYTFAATALAAERCGYAPCFLDVDPATWSLDPEALADHPALARAGVLLVVAPYGRLPDMRALERLHARCGLPVIVDAAAGFEQLAACPEAISATVPLALSFHATKTFSTGEGGAVVWDSFEGRAAIAQATNFGFLNSRECRAPGFNGKMSEYHAAVGLAMLDIFDHRQAAYAEISHQYRDIFAAHAVPGTLFVGPKISSAYALLLAESPAQADRFRRALEEARIGWRRWYEAGLHGMAHFRDCRADPLPVTEDLGARLLGLPMAPDLTTDEITKLALALARAEQTDQQGTDTHGHGQVRSAP